MRLKIISILLLMGAFVGAFVMVFQISQDKDGTSKVEIV